MIISPNFDYGKLAIIRNQSGLDSFKVSVKASLYHLLLDKKR